MPTTLHVYIVVLNWCSGLLTTRCMEACAALVGVRTTLVVCDNGSGDDSLARIEQAAEASHPGRWLRLDRANAAERRRDQPPVVVIRNGANLGFAAGCNVGIRFARAQPDCAYVWVLNNDTAPLPDALAALVRFAGSDPGLGICGSVIRYDKAPHRIQSAGGRLDRWFATTHLLCANDVAAPSPAAVANVDFIPGASMLASRAFLDRVGPMSEDYFLYFEEIDWAERGRSAFRYGICVDSVVHHVGGASIGNASDGTDRGLVASWYLLRGRMLFARKRRPLTAPLVAGGLLVSIVKRLVRGDFEEARIAWYALLDRPFRSLPHMALSASDKPTR